ncbi:hypothetical protein F2P56_030832 [Juglans regia]|uniref:Homeobox-leucine zipper protein n=2 Tax=Juglans regia TaxID=51240 RepID=A0A833UFE9_JUGRE|nr:homeobox-leucine zipper protein ATHB-12-like [Juglans regia]KAF5450480.1 hypothetical protein F2P56_030832 [Juglans regia]
MEGSEYLYAPAVPEGRYENITSVQQPVPGLSTPRKRKNKNKNKGRFSDEQIKSLESIFESETRLEPRKKVQLAGELGLQPRQVAIWFQNRRARWKSKQIEQEYRTLRDNYENLASQFESLKKEKQSLLIQLQKLGDLLGKTDDGNGDSKGMEGNNTVGRSDNVSNDIETKERPSCADEDYKNDLGSFGEEGHGFLNVSEQHGPLASLEKWYSAYDSGGLLDNSYIL